MKMRVIIIKNIIIFWVIVLLQISYPCEKYGIYLCGLTHSVGFCMSTIEGENYAQAESKNKERT